MERRTLQRSLLLQGEWGLTERVAVRAMIPYRDFKTSGEFEFNGDGMGDVEAWGLWRLGPETGKGGGAIGGGLSFPTGKDSPADLTGENVFFGTGAFSLLATVEGFRQLPAGFRLFGMARYRWPTAEGDDSYRFADVFGYSGTLAWQRENSPIGLMAGITGQHLGQDEQYGVKVSNRGGRLNYASLGASVGLGKGLALNIVSLWLVDQDVRGDQLLAEWQAVTGLTWAWGKHTHPEDED